MYKVLYFRFVCVVGMITSELPLSVLAIIASLSCSFVFMFLRVLDSECVLCVCGGLLFFCRVLMRSAVSILYVSRCGRERLDIAVSASRARFRIQFLGLSCRLYFGPFCS